MSAPSVPSSAPRERLGRGTLLALLVLPVGVAAWLVVWSLGYVAAIVAALVSVGAFWLYSRGAGSISRSGAFVVLGVTIVTLLVAFFAGIVLDVARLYGEGTGLGTWGAFTHELFWPSFWQDFPQVFAQERGDLLWAVGFGAVGSFATLRTAFTATRPASRLSVPSSTDVEPAPVAPEGDAPAVAYAPAVAPEASLAPAPAAEAVPEPTPEPDAAGEAPAR